MYPSLSVTRTGDLEVCKHPCIYCYPLYLLLSMYPCIHVSIPLGYTHRRPGGMQISMYSLLSIVSIVTPSLPVTRMGDLEVCK